MPESRQQRGLRLWWLAALVVVLALAIWFMTQGMPPRVAEEPDPTVVD